MPSLSGKVGPVSSGCIPPHHHHAHAAAHAALQEAHRTHQHQQAPYLKLLGTKEEMKRWKALKKLGINDDDFMFGCALMLDSTGPIRSKDEVLLGYSSGQIRRSKAVAVLGTTEEEIDELRTKKLSEIGTRRSVTPPASCFRWKIPQSQAYSMG
mmetsp:Transcript_26542/g.39418  ORF Transcript_26542/g.39418 Transcript_26542/m.39418 type:complete len:154 (-) Transcript_26542:208-669(-)|eukprot:CAMPEP_0185020378 /NCGR_PEP_ID=MMETSP1103-20130426/2983_1 /TAXON_ID=36769 /ORGANISM="Paraphysomonas bandaiensis, Strain Caron Lab Isolate" /LENGTH=153 /DNA_ID=CAMNT_0027551243 /DNA_START=222 /DNA_END=683 /DNA_ORIENTATION=+